MASRISELVLECRDPEAQARFWCEVLDFVILDREADGSVKIGPRGGSQPALVLSAHASPPPPRPFRLHFDINATDRDQEAELERLLALGARRADVGQTGDEPWVVLADPEDNVFCLLRGGN